MVEMKADVADGGASRAQAEASMYAITAALTPDANTILNTRSYT
jgi:hypothetical protein